jgi:hypothetical protein
MTTPPLENGYFKVGGVVSPITSSTTNSTLQDLDPVAFGLLDYFKGVITLHCGPRWVAECAAIAPLSGLPVVANMSALDPLKFRLSTDFQFPLLAMYPVSEGYTERTFSWTRTTTVYKIQWILPTLTAGQAERLVPFLRHTARALNNRTEDGFDQNYNSGALVMKIAGLDKVKFLSAQYGSIPDLDSDNYFPTVEMQLEVVERSDLAPGNFQTFAGVDNTIATADNQIVVLQTKKDF